MPLPILDTHGGVRRNKDKWATEERKQVRRKKRLLLPFVLPGGRQRQIETKTKAGVISVKWMRLMFVLPARVLCVSVQPWISVLSCKQSVIKDKRQQRAKSTRGTEADKERDKLFAQASYGLHLSDAVVSNCSVFVLFCVH